MGREIKSEAVRFVLRAPVDEAVRRIGDRKMYGLSEAVLTQVVEFDRRKRVRSVAKKAIEEERKKDSRD